MVDWLPRDQIIELRGVSVLVMMSLEYSYISEVSIIIIIINNWAKPLVMN